MGPHRSARRPSVLLVLALLLGSALVAASPLAAAEQNSYTVTPLVSDQAGVAAHTDPNLVNAWGLTASAGSPWWVADNGTDLSTLYGGDGTPRTLVVTVAGGPTGTVANTTTGFILPTGGRAAFLFDSEDGIVRAWNGAQGTTAIVVADRSNVGAIYKGLAIADTASGPRLYAADFHNARIDVFDGSFGLVPGGFVDPSLPDGYAPFNVQTIGDRVFVAYAKQDENAEDEVAGQGARLRRRVRPRGQPARASGPARPAERAVGARPRAGGVRPLRRRPARRQLRRRADQRLRGAAERALRPPRRAARLGSASHSRSTGSGRSASATAPTPGRRTRCSSRPARTKRPTGSSGRSPQAEELAAARVRARRRSASYRH